MRVDLTRHVHAEIANIITKIFSIKEYEAEVDVGIWTHLTRLKQDYLNANNNDENEELLLFLHAMLWLKKQSRYQNYKIVTDFFNSLDNNNWLGIVISEDEQNILASITSIVEPAQAPEQKEHWHAEKSKLFVTIYKALINHIITSLEGNNDPDYEAIAGTLINFELSITKRQVTKPIADGESYKLLLGIIHFNLACIYMKQGNPEEAKQAYNVVKLCGNKPLTELAQQRLSSFSKTHPISDDVKNSHSFYRFGYPMPELLPTVKPVADPVISQSNQTVPVTKRSPWLISFGIIFAALMLTLAASVLVAHFGITLPVLTMVGAFLINPMPHLLVPLIASVTGVLALIALAITVTEIAKPGVLRRSNRNSAITSTNADVIDEDKSLTQISSYQKLPEDMQQSQSSAPAIGSASADAHLENFSSIFASDESHPTKQALTAEDKKFIEEHEAEIDEKIKNLQPLMRPKGAPNNSTLASALYARKPITHHLLDKSANKALVDEYNELVNDERYQKLKKIETQNPVQEYNWQ